MGRYGLPVSALWAFALLAGVLCPSCSREGARLDHDTGVLEYRDGDLLYTFHIPTGTEALFDLDRDPCCLDNILPENRDLAAFARRRLERAFHVQSLEDLRDQGDPVLRSLRGLGYL